MYFWGNAIPPLKSQNSAEKCTGRSVPSKNRRQVIILMFLYNGIVPGFEMKEQTHQ